MCWHAPWQQPRCMQGSFPHHALKHRYCDGDCVRVLSGWSEAACFLLTHSEEGRASAGCARCSHKQLCKILLGYRQRSPPETSQGILRRWLPVMSGLAGFAFCQSNSSHQLCRVQHSLNLLVLPNLRCISLCMMTARLSLMPKPPVWFRLSSATCLALLSGPTLATCFCS